MPDVDSLELLTELSTQHPWLKTAVDELARIPLPQWQGEYTRLFVSGFPNTLAPPYESVHRHRSMFGPVVDALSALYQSAGLAAEQMPADYLGVELECAAFLSDSRSPEAAILRQRLWREHLGKWLPAFAADLRNHSRLQIYRSWGDRLSLLCATTEKETAYA